jgi:hypothetical protein
MVNNENCYDMFHVSLSTIAHEQLHVLEQQRAYVNINNGHDKWNFSWGNQFSTKKLYTSHRGTS